ncbi:DJ-1/PfpI family protein [Nocardia mangyaensis]|uniref:DJ-1/PfpI family protein n=1 Tax=Nocardia mangyaensis TaxID=2213200 RepID=UPI002674B057|nr:DJ-1/PfpI family protein [Nocardia mangyaensis]MDO3651260.1 DJ-1/PfpI family protein [Nocardia mangyaensis]
MQIAIVVYPGMTALDAIGPYELLRTLTDPEIRFVWHEPGPIVTDSGALILAATHSFEETPAPDLILIGGSLTSTMQTAGDEKLLAWLRQAHATATWTVSSCSGSVLLAAAGLLAGKPATSHWAALPVLLSYGAKPDGKQRIVREGKIITAAGVSAGLDLGLWLVGEIEGRERAEAAQLLIEYDPQPPFDSGHLGKASAATKARALALTKQLVPGRELLSEGRAGAKVLWSNAIERARGRRR